MSRYLEEVTFRVTKDVQDALRRIHRGLRSSFATSAAEIARSIADAVCAAEQASGAGHRHDGRGVARSGTRGAGLARRPGHPRSRLTSDSSKTGRRVASYGRAMAIHIDVIGIVVADMARALAFYRHLGFDVPASADTEPHVEVPLPGGLRLAFDTVDTIRSSTWGGQRRPEVIGSASPLRARAPPRSTRRSPSSWRPATRAISSHGTPSGASATRRVHDPDGNSVELFAVGTS